MNLLSNHRDRSSLLALIDYHIGAVVSFTAAIQLPIAMATPACQTLWATPPSPSSATVLAALLSIDQGHFHLHSSCRTPRDHLSSQAQLAPRRPLSPGRHLPLSALSLLLSYFTIVIFPNPEPVTDPASRHDLSIEEAAHLERSRPFLCCTYILCRASLHAEEPLPHPDVLLGELDDSVS